MNKELIFQNIPDKRDYKGTTSLKFKQELLEFFEPLKLNNCIEVGTAYGHTTRILSYLFNKVVTIELNERYIDAARELNKDRVNIEYLQGDAYGTDWNIDKKFDIAFIDCNHQYDQVKKDFINCRKLGVKFFVFDDYGLDESTPSVKIFVDECINNRELEVVKYIGEPKGSQLWKKYNRNDELVDWEGIICKYEGQ